MADTNVAIKLYKTSSTAKRVGINVTNNTDTTGYALYVNGTIYGSAVEGNAIRAKNTNSSWAGISCWITDVDENNWRTFIGSDSNHLIIRTRSYNSTTGIYNSHYETYTLPEVTADRTSNGSYSILTSKEAITVAQGGTGATTASGALNNLGAAAASHTHNYLPVHYTTLDYTSVTAEPGTYIINNTHPVTGLSEYGSIIQFTGLSSDAKYYGAQLIISSASGATSGVHAYIRRMTSTPGWSTWSVIFDNRSNLIPDADATYSIGSSSKKYTTIYTTTFNGNISLPSTSGTISLEGHTHAASAITSGALAVANGGTGGTSVIGANNNLQTWSLGPGTAISSNANLNSYTTIGNYNCSVTTTARTILNTPYGATASSSMEAFVLKVCYATGNSTQYLKQELNIYNRYQNWVRYSTNSGTSWSDWAVRTYKYGTGVIGGTNTPVYVTDNGALTPITTAIPITLGGTGATTAANARTNLGLGSALLLSGVQSSNTISGAYSNYSGFIVRGVPGTSAYSTCFIPKAAITTSDTTWQVADEGYYITFKIRYSGNNLIFGNTASNNGTKSVDIYGII